MTRSIRLHELAISNTIGNLRRALVGIPAGTTHPSTKSALENELMIVKRELVEHLAQLAAPTPTPITEPIEPPITEPIEPPITEPIDDEPILIPVTPPVLEQTKVFGLSLKQLAVLIGIGVLIL